MRELAAGTVVDGRYRIVTRLGSGGMADVYCAEDSQLGRQIALKILYGRFAEDDEFVERFRREASHAAGLQHQNVVAVYDRGEWDSTSYIAMEFVDGRTLKQIIQAEGPLAPLRAIELISQVLRAARFAHRRGVIHRDLKPHNVIVDADDRAKVTDFGIARAGASDMTQTGSIMGTAQYLSPEQAQGHPVSAASDIYSVGIVLYEMLTGKVPFDGDSPVTIALKQVNEPPVAPAALNPAVPAPLQDVVLRALAKDPEDRYPDADAFIAALDDAKAQIVAGTAPPAQATAAFTPVDGPGARDATTVLPASSWVEPEGVYVAEDAVAREERRWPWALLLILLIAGAIVAGVLLLGGGGTKVKVPSVVGTQSSAAAARLHADGLEVDINTVVSDQPRGVVIRQDPVAGTRVKKGTTVALAVSSGAAPRQVPPLEGQPRLAARRALKKLGFKIREQHENSDTVGENRVITTHPGSGTPLDPGATVELVISSGAERVDLPRVVGQKEDEARAALEDAGFVVRVKDQPTDSDPPGTVLAQDPAAGRAPKGATVTITVARESESVAVPDVTGENSSDAIDALSSAGFRVRTRTQPVDSPEGDDVVLSQSPPGGASRKAKRGSAVTITVGRFTPALDPEGGGQTTPTTPAPVPTTPTPAPTG
jgi:serine/threonine-protein kinase